MAAVHSSCRNSNTAFVRIIVWVFRERADGGGCGAAGHGFASSLARYAHIDGRNLGHICALGVLGVVTHAESWFRLK